MADRYKGLRPDFAEKAKRIERDLSAWCSKHWPGHSARMSEGFRTVAQQRKHWAKGRDEKGRIVDQTKVVTYKNGTTNKSAHQLGKAADIVGVTPDGKLTWDCPVAFWSYLGHLARREGLVWGGSWAVPYDRPHIEEK